MQVTPELLSEQLGGPGSVSKPAPTTIPHPRKMGATAGFLEYVSLPALIELKLAAGRARDEADVVELVRSNPTTESAVAQHLAGVQPEYVTRFQDLAAKGPCGAETLNKRSSVSSATRRGLRRACSGRPFPAQEWS